MSSPTVAKTKDPSSIAKPGGIWAHNSFLLSMFLKGSLGFSQLVGGLALILAPSGTFIALAHWLVRAELAEDPSDPFARWAEHFLSVTPMNEGAFYAVYLTLHGVLNLGLVLALLAKIQWAYPVSILSLVGFVAYQVYKYSISGSSMMLVLSAIDVVVIALIWREFRATKAARDV
jgi:uncharacterized membrane protein